jgi:hypothetical protein
MLEDVGISTGFAIALILIYLSIGGLLTVIVVRALNPKEVEYEGATEGWSPKQEIDMEATGEFDGKALITQVDLDEIMERYEDALNRVTKWARETMEDDELWFAHLAKTRGTRIVSGQQAALVSIAQNRVIPLVGPNGPYNLLVIPGRER